MRMLAVVGSVLVITTSATVALAAGTLRVLGNACDAATEPKFTNHQQIHSALGRLKVVDSAGLALHQETDVVVTPAVDAQSCLWQFNVRFDDALVSALLAGELFVELDLCTAGPVAGGNAAHHIAHVTSCDFGDPALPFIAEPLDTVLADVAAAVLALVEASCPEGAALRAIDVDGSPRYVCTESLATAADLMAEREARAAGDAALEGSVSAVGAALANEAALRALADQALQTQLYGQAADIASLASANVQQQAQIDLNASDIASQQARINGLTAFDANLAQACPLGYAVGGVGGNGVPTCVPVGGARVASTLATSTSQCAYGCSSNVGFAGCGCSCRHGFFSSCSCSCSSTATASCSTSSCTAPPVDVGCPSVGGGQGQSTLASCVPPSTGFVPPNYDRCAGAAPTASGPVTSCTSTLTRGCSCSCSGNWPGSCSCSCVPAGTVSCTAPTQTASPTVSARALCLYVE